MLRARTHRPLPAESQEAPSAAETTAAAAAAKCAVPARLAGPDAAARITDPGRSQRVLRRAGAAVMLSAAVFTVIGCSSAPAPSMVGIWQADDGSGLKTVSDDGSCTGMYYNGATPLDIGGGMTCTMGEAADDGSYLLLVSQPPNERSYRVSFTDDGDTAVLMSSGGETIVTLQRQ